MEQQIVEGLQSNQQAYHHCFIGHAQGASWRETFEQVCEEVLPHFGLQPWYANKHFQGGIPLREKVVKMIATTRYGIYDLSFWRENEQSAWIMPRNVLIELGMAITLNRPMLLLRHANNRESGLSLPGCLEGIEIGEFGNGKKLLKQTLQARLPFLTHHTPQQDWLNRYCHFGAMQCSHRESHPQALQWGRQKIHIHIADGTNDAHIDESEFRDMLEEEVITRFNHLEFNYLDSLTCPQGCQFLLCSRCQEVRTSPFAIYRITPHTSADTFIAIGMSIALEKQFSYPIPKILITEDEQHIPSLLKGYEIIVERKYNRIKDRLNIIIPEMMEETRRTIWKPQSLPFEVFLPPKEYTLPEETILVETNREDDKEQIETEKDTSSQLESKEDQISEEPESQKRFERLFTERSKAVLRLAQEEAQRFLHNYVGTEHLLLGLVREGEGVAGRVLANLGVNLNKARRAVEFIMGRGDRILQDEIELSPRCRRVIGFAVTEKDSLNDHHIDTEHLLLALVHLNDGIGVGILDSMNIDLEQLRIQTLQMRGIPVSETLSEDEGNFPPLEMEYDPISDQLIAVQIGPAIDKFTGRTRTVLKFARKEAQRFQHKDIGTEHLLLGLLDICEEREAVATKVLSNLGVGLRQVRGAVEFIIGRGDSIFLGKTGLNPRSKKVIDLTLDEARRLNHQYIDTEHLLLGLIREGEGIAAGVLENLGITLENARVQTVRILSETFAEDENQIQSDTNSLQQQEIVYDQQANDRDRFDKFTRQARTTLSLAQEEAQRLQHNYIGTEHLLLGLVCEGKSGAARVLADLGVNLNKVRSAVEYIIGRGDRIVLGEIGLTPRAKKVIELAVDEARRLNHQYISTEHLLLAIVREGEGVAAGIIESLGVNLEKVRIQTLQVLKTDI